MTLPHKERRLKDIETLKGKVLQAARDLAVKEGWSGVSIREIGKIVQYTSPVIYEHFKNKEAILIELEEMGFRELRTTLMEARTRSSQPTTQLEDISAAFWDWAFYNAELYQVMFNLEGIHCSPTNPNALKEATTPVIEILKQINLFSGELDELFFHWWAIVHGHISLVMSGQIKGMDTRIRKYMISAVQRFTKSIS
ncbi:MAG: TetR/AcrR family transcriptional regulator [Bacteroidia bacterium]|nr:TetR/AcrR family transcriptional regulator [Bacteroidia bacterium]